MASTSTSVNQSPTNLLIAAQKDEFQLSPGNESFRAGVSSQVSTVSTRILCWAERGSLPQFDPSEAQALLLLGELVAALRANDPDSQAWLVRKGAVRDQIVDTPPHPRGRRLIRLGVIMMKTMLTYFSTDDEYKGEVCLSELPKTVMSILKTTLPL